MSIKSDKWIRRMAEQHKVKDDVSIVWRCNTSTTRKPFRKHRI